MKLRLVLDKNIILSSISTKSPYHNILKFLFAGFDELCVTTDILLEYEEKITSNFDEELAQTFISALLIKKNVKKIVLFFNLNLINVDKDDNKFSDCAFASNAHLLVTNDKHFNILKSLEFPRIEIMNIDMFNAYLIKSFSTN